MYIKTEIRVHILIILLLKVRARSTKYNQKDRRINGVECVLSPDEWGPLLMQIGVIVGALWGLWSGWNRSRKKKIKMNSESDVQ